MFVLCKKSRQTVSNSIRPCPHYTFTYYFIRDRLQIYKLFLLVHMKTLWCLDGVVAIPSDCRSDNSNYNNDDVM